MSDKEYPPGCEAFLRYLTAQPLGPYRVERVDDARGSVLVHFRLAVGTCVVPMAVIFDMTRYLTIRVNLADWLGGCADDDCAAALLPVLARWTYESRVVRYYLTPAMSPIADLSLPDIGQPLPPQRIHGLLTLMAMELQSHAGEWETLFAGK